jgi:hypothetical protein
MRRPSWLENSVPMSTDDRIIARPELSQPQPPRCGVVAVRVLAVVGLLIPAANATHSLYQLYREGLDFEQGLHGFSVVLAAFEFLAVAAPGGLALVVLLRDWWPGVEISIL